MNVARLLTGALLRLAILAAFVWLALNDHPWMAVAVLALYFATALEPKPTTTRSSAAATPPKP